MNAFPLGSHVNLADVVDVACAGLRVVFPPSSRKKVQASRKVLLGAVEGDIPIYGVNTGFGDLANKKIPLADVRKLQRNLVLSHACGLGKPLSPEESRAVLFLRANELAKGKSGVRPELVEILAALLNRGVVPAIPSRGSVGASGDLTVLAHMALVLLGEGKAWMRRREVSGREALRKAGLKPLELDLKEGLSLINGTQGMQSVGALALDAATKAFWAATAASAMSLEALKGTPDPYRPEIHRLKPHPGQRRVAGYLFSALSQSEIRKSHIVGDERVQDAYSLRCIPQVHGAVLDCLDFAVKTLETELNSVTDNPVVLSGRILSGGNFHGQALSFAFDYAAIAMTALANISERRIFQLVSDPARILPLFLTSRAGIESGWMIAQTVAASAASENKTLSHPAAADSIPTSGNKEDFVSMGMWAALKLNQVVENALSITAIELLAAAQGVEFHSPLKPGRRVRRILEKVRAVAPRITKDTPLAPFIESLKERIVVGDFR